MPSSEKFLKAFSLTFGRRIGSYLLISVSSEHIPEIRYRKYNYPITLVFQQTGNDPLDKFLLDLTYQLQGSHVVESDYHNPYLCWIDTTDSSVTTVANQIIVKVKGHSVRQ